MLDFVFQAFYIFKTAFVRNNTRWCKMVSDILDRNEAHALVT